MRDCGWQETWKDPACLVRLFKHTACCTNKSYACMPYNSLLTPCAGTLLSSLSSCVRTHHRLATCGDACMDTICHLHALTAVTPCWNLPTAVDSSVWPKMLRILTATFKATSTSFKMSAHGVAACMVNGKNIVNVHRVA